MALAGWFLLNYFVVCSTFFDICISEVAGLPAGAASRVDGRFEQNEHRHLERAKAVKALLL